MAIESYDQIMARLNNPYGYAPMQPQEPAATDFTNFVINYLNDPNPKGGMFRLQDEIDERKLKSKQEDAAKAAQAAGGMFVPVARGEGGDSGGNVELTPEQIAFLERETPEERYARITGDWFGLKPIGAYLVGGIPGLMAQQGYTPEAMMDRGIGLFRQAMGDTDGYVSPTYTPKPAGVAAPVVSGQTNYNTYSPDAYTNNIMNTGTPYVEITPTFDYSSSGGDGGASSDGFSSSGSGDYSFSSDTYGGYI